MERNSDGILTPKEKEALLRVLRPGCFGKYNCTVDKICRHIKACNRRWRSSLFMKQAIEKLAEHKRKVKFFERKIKYLKEKGIPLP